MKKNLRIAVNAQIPQGGGAGGIETVLRVLATSLGALDGDEEYVFITHPTAADWLSPLLTKRQTVVRAPVDAQAQSNRTENFKRILGKLRPIVRGVKHLFAPPVKTKPTVPTSNGFYESLNCDVVHFPYQDYVYCRVPTVYNPHDLQHLHFPQFFALSEIERREIVYPAACRAAHTVVVASEFVKQDVIENYGVAADKVQVVRWSPPETNLEKSAAFDWRALSEKYRINYEEPFALYPAMTWEHKNHIRLLEAVALLRKRENLKINLVCTGDKNAFFPHIERRLRDLKLENQVIFTGIVSPEELSALYFRARFVIIPTLFEAMSAPLFEAWRHDVAAACSSVTALPEQAGNAALLFNPYAVEEIAGALKRMAADENLRRELRANGTRRLENFSLERTARAYRAVYRQAAGIVLSDDDRDLLSGNASSSAGNIILEV